MVAENFQTHDVKIPEKSIYESKIESAHSYLGHLTKIFPRFLSLPLWAGENYPFLQTTFINNNIFFLGRIRGQLWSLKNYQN